MFRATVFASRFREQMAHFLNMVKGDHVLQIIQRGEGIKVVMTQEHYLDLVGRLAIYEQQPNEELVPHETVEETMKRLALKRKRIEEEEVEYARNSRAMGKKRKKST